MTGQMGVCTYVPVSPLPPGARCGPRRERESERRGGGGSGVRDARLMYRHS